MTCRELRRSAGERYTLLDEVLVIDFKPVVYAGLQRWGIACVYGDVAHISESHRGSGCTVWGSVS